MEPIDANYHQQIAGIKDGKTRRHAEQQWTNDFMPLWKLVEQMRSKAMKLKREHRPSHQHSRAEST
jgi:hypothetical protein